MRKASWVVFILCALSVAGICFHERHFLSAIFFNNRSLVKLEAKLNYDAFPDEIEALRHMPLAPELHINLGDLYLANKDFEKAEKEFLTAAKLASGSPAQAQTLFYALFNAAVASTQLKQIDQALSFYQQCLEVDKTSIPVKTNIELLVKSQSGKGQGGDGDNQDQNQSEGDKDQKDKKDDPNRKASNQMPKNMPQPYKGKEISQENVNKILEELKNQEQNVRAKFEQRGRHTSENEKDW